jgi:hypothetical protein
MSMGECGDVTERVGATEPGLAGGTAGFTNLSL